MIVVLPLVPNGENGHRRLVFDFKQRNVSGRAEGDDQFPQEWIVVIDLAATEGEILKELKSLEDGIAGTPGCAKIFIEKEVV